MCTVVFIPGNKAVFLGSLRDESPKRPRATKPAVSEIDGLSFLAPTDTMAGGTWLGVNSIGNIIILLNGGFENHSRKNYYRKSRGLIVTELLALAQPVIEWDMMEMEDIEPFTLIIWANNNLYQLVWDGNKRHKIQLDQTLPYIWSSATLYNAAAKAKREQLFKNWMAANPLVSNLSLLDFFKSYHDAENGFMINRNESIKTLSFSSIKLAENNKAVMCYYDFFTPSYSNKLLPLQSELNLINDVINYE